MKTTLNEQTNHNEHMGYASIIQRIKTILFAVFCACVGNGLLSYLVPLDLQSNNISQTLIGFAVSAFSVGFLIGCLASHQFIGRVGHIRTYASMAALLAIIGLLHSMFGDFSLTILFRFATGLAMANIYITLESWLNGESSITSRGTILGVYQTAVAIGMSLSPWFLNAFTQGDPRLYSIASLLFALSLIPLSMSRRPAPQIPTSTERYGLLRLYLDSPAAVISNISAGLLVLPLAQLMVLFLVDENYSRSTLSLIFSFAFVGVFLLQMPVGKLADRFDKRKITLVLLAALSLLCIVMIYNSLHLHSLWVLIIAYLFAMGCSHCLLPLSMALIFEQVETEHAVGATSSMLVVHGLGLIAGPIIAGTLMNYFGSDMLLYYTLIISIAVMIFIFIRIYVRKITIHQEGLPYHMTIQSIGPSSLNLNPAFNYSISQLNDSAFTSLVNALTLTQNHEERKKVLEESLYQFGMQPEKIILHLILALPRMSDKILKSVISLHPELRFELMYALDDVIKMDKKRINAMLIKGLNHQSSRSDRAEIKKYFERSIQEGEAIMASMENDESRNENSDKEDSHKEESRNEESRNEESDKEESR